MGNVSYSNEVFFKTNEITSYKISPNPAKYFFCVTGADKIDLIMLTDYSGKTVKAWNKNILNNYNVKGIQKGVYIIKIYSNGNLTTSFLNIL